MADYKQIKKETLELVADLILDELKFVLVKEGKLKATGGLVESLQTRIGEDTIVVLGIDYTLEYQQGKPKGTWVPFESLLKWVQRYRQFKPLLFRNSKGQFITNQAIAKIVQRAIFKNGVKPKPYFDNVLNNKEEDIRKLIEQEFARAIEIEIENQLQVS